ncbi:MAG TPA: glycoside hydrolase family 28 protein [Longimicrobiaceae bacterium]|nr:glycoside hydrolase family 28 protein [Longimicrobiaceae bacterium]
MSADPKLSRRDFVGSLALGAGAALLGPGLLGGCRTAGGAAPASAGRQATGWDALPGILARIRPPSFPNRDFVITRYGAKAGADSTEALRQAIAAAHAAGGGRVVVPEGRFLTGAVHLLSNVNLHLSAGSTLAFSTDPNAYLPVVLTRFESTELMGYSPFIYALDQENVAITGEGTLDGQASAENWWTWKGIRAGGWKPGMPNYNSARNQLLEMAEKGVPVEQRVFGAGSYLRPNFIQPYRCRNVLIEGVTIVNSPMWEINPTLCQNVTVRDVTIHSHGPNNDGCDPDSCRDVLIEGCTFDTGDDCIAIKSGRNADGRRLHTPSENIVVRNCHMMDGHGGVTVGSEISGGVRNVFAEKCQMSSPRLDRALRIKNNAMRGGLLEHIYMRDVQVGQVANGVVDIDFTYEEGANGPYTPVVRDVDVRNVTSQKSRYALYLRGLPNAPIYGVHLEDCTFRDVAEGNVLEYVRGVELENVTMNGEPLTEASLRA